ncbi:MAG: hypothetical protein MUC75_01575 [Ignavibacteriaceae bacterium]|nr:hypothetical protein [Ignavibacteriaceae bacterium]
MINRNLKQHNRRSIRLKEFEIIVQEEWLKTELLRENIELDHYVIMPNHFHEIPIINSRDTARCVPTDENRKFGVMIPGSLPVIIRSFKSAVIKRINEYEIHLEYPSGRKVIMNT